MNNQFSIGDIIVHKEPNRENTYWVIVGYGTLNKLRSVENYYKLVPIERLEDHTNPFESEIEHTHKNYHKAT